MVGWLPLAGPQRPSTAPDFAGSSLQDRHGIEARLRACRWNREAIAQLRLAVARSAMPSQLALLSDDELLDYCVALVRQRVLLPVDGGIGATSAALSDAERSRHAEERVLREFAAREHSFRVGRQVVRLASVAQWWAELGRSDRYAVLPKEAALGVLTSLANTPGVTPRERAALDEVQGLLAETGRRLTKGLIVLACTPSRVIKSEVQASPAVTPSSLRASRTPPAAQDNHWIEIVLQDDDGNPIPDEPFLLTDGNGAEHQGRVDGEGFARVEALCSGGCELVFPNLYQRMRPAWHRNDP